MNVVFPISNEKIKSKFISFGNVGKKSKLSNFEADRTKIAEVRAE